MKYLILLLFTSFSIQLTQAQKKQNVYFLQKNGKEALSREVADVIRIVVETDLGDNRFGLLEYYKNGNKKTQGYVSIFEPNLVFEGAVVGYDSLGIKAFISNYEKGILSGVSQFYYPNGKMSRKVEYVKTNSPANQMIGQNSPSFNSMFDTFIKVLYVADSNGVESIVDGNGHLKQIEKIDDNEIREEGDYLNGFKNGIWTGIHSKSGMTYKEIYESGKLISGESIKEGKTYSYLVNLETPTFPGGIQAWNRFIANSVRYPSDAQKDGITGKVETSFVIDQNGKVVDIKIERSVSKSLDEEARRVLSYSPKWNPGKQYGVPIRVKYNQPINFNM